MTTLGQVLATEVQRFLQPVDAAATDQNQRRKLLAAVVENVSEDDLQRVEAQLQSIATNLNALADTVENPPESLDDYDDLLTELKALIDSVLAIEDALGDAGFNGVGGELLEYLGLAYLQSTHPPTFYVGTLLTIISVPDPSAEDAPKSYRTGTFFYKAAQYAETDFQLDRISDLLDDPVTTLQEAYLPDGQVIEDELFEIEARLFPWLMVLLGALGFRPTYSLSTLPIPESSGYAATSRSIRFDWGVTDDVDFGLEIAFASASDGVRLIFVPHGNAAFDVQSDEWAASFELSGTTEAFAVGADGLDFGSNTGVSATGRVEKLPEEGTDSSFVVGPESGTRLEIGRFAVKGTTEFFDDRASGDVLARASDSTFALAPGDGDSFLGYVLPEDGVSADFDLGLGWSSRKGVYLEGSGSLDAHLPLHLSFGEALTVDALDVSVSADDGSIPVSVTTTPNVELGPVAGAIEGVGLRADFAFPEGMDGNLGPLDLGFGFEPPSGIALSIDAGTVTGGGYLSFDPENERYTGAISLDVGKLTLNAIGLLTTELPDGSDGFSLLVVITGEFPPVQLGFGFTLNGVGGLLGVNRSARVSALRSSVREGSLESVLFPQDPLSNVPRLVSDLRGFFPATKDQHVFGPMAKINWGTPSIIEADLGVILELPSPLRLLVLGRLSAVLPDDDAAILQLQMNALGVINFTEQKASLDASLYDSRVAAFSLTGDMAMRTDWGGDPGFGLSVGGWNPRFEPPENFPALDRVAVSLTDGNNPRLRLAGYFAVTSNTAQVGAAVDLYAAAAGFSVDGHLGFDALFKFDPFKFVVDVGASVAFKHGSTTLLSASFDGTLSGPTPWHARGKASIEILFLEASVSFDAKFGSSSQPGGMPPAEVLSKLAAAVGDRRNWTAQMPETDASFVHLREIEPGDDDVLAHPLGQLGFRQRVVPLGIRIEKYGSTKPADYNTFSIGAVRTVAPIGGETRENQTHDRGDLRANFAPDQYFKLSDSERLSRPSFEKLPAGEVVASDGLAFGGMDDESRQGVASHARTRTLKYESHYVDEDETKTTDTVLMARTTADSLAEVSAVATGEARNSGRKSFVGPDQSVPVADATYVVASVTDLRQRIDSGLPETGTTYVEAEQALETYRTDHAVDDLQVVASHEAREPEGVTP